MGVWQKAGLDLHLVSNPVRPLDFVFGCSGMKRATMYLMVAILDVAFYIYVQCS